LEDWLTGGSVIHRFVFHNEELKAVDKVRWSPGQAGLICGWGLFTTVRIVRGEAFAYERHWRRLEKDAALTRLPLNYSSAKVRVQLQDVIRANKVEDGCARIYLVWNAVGFWKSEEKMPEVDLVIASADVPAYPDTLRVSVREHGRHAASPLAGVKTTSWLNSVWAVAEAQREGFDEVVLLNERGEVSECTAANIFAVKGDKVLTPPLNSGCLEGVTRGVLTEVAAEAGTSVVEQTLRVEDLYGAEEVFITSTNRNVIGIREIAGRKIGNGTTGEVTKRLDVAFDAFVKDYVERRMATNR
jgi:branched-chain amino acid aminotransferase